MSASLLVPDSNVMASRVVSPASYQYILKTETILTKYSSLTVSEIVKVTTSVDVYKFYTGSQTMTMTSKWTR